MCQCRSEWLVEMMSVKAGVVELTEFKNAVKQQLHNFINKRMPVSGPAGAKRLVCRQAGECGLALEDLRMHWLNMHNGWQWVGGAGA